MARVSTYLNFNGHTEQAFELMGTDASASMGFKLSPGDNVPINLEPDSRAEADCLFRALSAGGKTDMPMADMFWAGRGLFRQPDRPLRHPLAIMQLTKPS